MVRREKVASFDTVFDQRPQLIPLIASKPEVFTRFYQLYFRKIWNIFYRKLEDGQASDELTQSLFIKIRQKVETYEEQGIFTHWVLRVARNAALNAVRDRNRSSWRIVSLHGWEETNDLDIPSPTPEEMYEEIEELGILEEVLKQLPEEENEILFLKYVEQMTNKEIGEQIGLSEGAVKSKLHRIHERLRKFWQLKLALR